MIDTSAIITLILAGNSDWAAEQVTRAKEIEGNLQSILDLPMIYVGFATIESLHPNLPIEKNVFNTHGENLIQSFDISIVCLEQDLTATWIKVYKSLIGKNPNPAERMRTGLTYAQGGKAAISNGKIWHVDRWRIGFPTLFTNF